MKLLKVLAFLSVTLLGNSNSSYAVSGKNVNAVSADYREHHYVVKEGKEGTPSSVINIKLISINVSASLLFGEPVIVCNASWQLESIGMIDRQTVMLQTIPKKVLDEVYLYQVKLAFPTQDEKYLLCDPGVFYPSASGKASFNVPGSPAWHKMYRYASYMGRDKNTGGYADEAEAKAITRELLDNGFPEWHQSNRKTLKIAAAKINLAPVKRWLNQQKLITQQKQSAKQQGQSSVSQQALVDSEALDDDLFDAMISGAKKEVEHSNNIAVIKKQQLISSQTPTLKTSQRISRLLKKNNSCLSDEKIIELNNSAAWPATFIKQMTHCDISLTPFKGNNGYWGYKNTSGKIVVSAQYVGVDEFEGGRALAKRGKLSKAGADNYYVSRRRGTVLLNHLGKVLYQSPGALSKIRDRSTGKLKGFSENITEVIRGKGCNISGINGVTKRKLNINGKRIGETSFKKVYTGNKFCLSTLNNN